MYITKSFGSVSPNLITRLRHSLDLFLYCVICYTSAVPRVKNKRVARAGRLLATNPSFSTIFYRQEQGAEGESQCLEVKEVV